MAVALNFLFFVVATAIIRVSTNWTVFVYIFYCPCDSFGLYNFRLANSASVPLNCRRTFRFPSLCCQRIRNNEKRSTACMNYILNINEAKRQPRLLLWIAADFRHFHFSRNERDARQFQNMRDWFGKMFTSVVGPLAFFFWTRIVCRFWRWLT